MTDDMNKRRDELAINYLDQRSMNGHLALNAHDAFFHGFDAGIAEMQEQVDELKKELNTSKMLKDLYHKSSIKFELELKKFNRFADFVSNDEEIAVIEKERDTLKQQLEIAVNTLNDLNEFTSSILEDMKHYFETSVFRLCAIVDSQLRQALTQIKELHGSPSGIADREESK